LLKAIIFDFDGLILETETPIYQAWQEVFALYGYHLPFELWQDGIGYLDSSFNPYETLEAWAASPIPWEEVEPRRILRERELVEQQALLPGVAAYLERAQQLGYQMAVASSSPHAWVDGHLGRLGLQGAFHSVRCAEDVPVSKPHPAVYQLCLEDLGAAPGAALALEDSPPGALAADQAGIFCVVVPNGLTSQMQFEAGDLFLKSLDLLPFDMLVDWFSGAAFHRRMAL
jgi:HAD superfamily hydrolase (TIGR01509 family)